MTCYHPIPAYTDDRVLHPSGKPKLQFNVLKGVGRAANPHITLLKVPCGKCEGCLLDRSKKWAIRCMHEASLHDNNCFLTLTYDDKHLPIDGSLNIEDFQLFMKRLRKKYGNGIRFFHCGEYGSLHFRPHHHAIIFGHDFNDKEMISLGRDVNTVLYRSNSLSLLWPYGFTSIGSVTERSCAYVARYILKKVNRTKQQNFQFKPEYITMSRRPGIAHDWILRYKDDVYPHDYVVLSNGIKAKPPAYYDKIYDIIQNDYSLIDIKNKRIEQMKNNPDYNDPARLATKETLQKLRTKKLVRNLETML